MMENFAKYYKIWWQHAGYILVRANSD